MEKIPYEVFILIHRRLSMDDILSTCSVNKLYNSYLHRPSFWSDLLVSSYGVRKECAIRNDYLAYYKVIEVIPLASFFFPKLSDIPCNSF